MTPAHYTAKILPDGHMPLPKDFPAHAGDEVEITVAPVVPATAGDGPDIRTRRFLETWVGAGAGSGDGVAEHHDEYLYKR